MSVEAVYQFDPVLYSKEENVFLLSTLGEAPIVALKKVSDGVNPKAVQPLLARVYELVEQEKIEGVKWVGIPALKEKIQAYLTHDAKWEADYIRTGRRAPRFPSLYSYDTKGRPHRGGPGADSDRVRSYFVNGERIPFQVAFFPNDLHDWVPPTKEGDGPVEKGGLEVDRTMNRIECKVPTGDDTICGHTESFKPDSRASFNAARARMSKHLRKATASPIEHREVHTNEFTS